MSMRNPRREAVETSDAIRDFERRRKYRIVPILTSPTSSSQHLEPGSLADVQAATTLMKRVGVSGIQKTSITHREFLIDGVAFRNYPCVPVRLSPPQSFAKTIVQLRRNAFTCEMRRRMPLDITSGRASLIRLDCLEEWTAAWSKRCTMEKGTPYRTQGSMGDTPQAFQAFFLGYFADKCVCNVSESTQWYTLIRDGLMEQLPFEFMVCKLALVLCSSRARSSDYISVYFSIVHHLVIEKRVRTLTVQDIVALIATCETLLELNDIPLLDSTTTTSDRPITIQQLKMEASLLCDWQGTRLELSVQEMMQGITERCPTLSSLLNGSEATRLADEAVEVLVDHLPTAVIASSTSHQSLAQSGVFTIP